MTTIEGARRTDADPGVVYAARVERGIEVGAVVLVLATLAGAWLWLPSAPLGWTAAHWVLLAYTAVAVPGVLVAVTGLLPRRRAAMRVVTACAPVLALVTLLRAGLDWDTGGGSISVLAHAMTGPLHASPQSWGPRRSLVIAGLTLPLHAAERVLASGPVVGLAETGALLLIYLLCLQVTTIFRQLASLVLSSSEVRRRAEHEAYLVRAAVEIRARWDALVHDRVLAALRLAYRGDVRGAQELAQASLESLEELKVADQPRLLRDQIAQQAARLGLALDLRLTGRDPERLSRENRSALLAAVEQVLTNVGQHSGTDRAAVHVHGDGTGVQVEIRDEGEGFDQRAVPADRLGLRLGVQDRMALVGGEVQITSSPARGTSVTMTVPWDRQLDVGPDPNWLRHQLRPLLAVGVAHILAQVTLVLAAPDPGRSRLVVVTGALVLLTATVVLVRARGRTTPWWTAYLVLLGVQLVFVLNVTSLWPPSEQTWYRGAFVFPVLVVTVGASWRWGALVVGHLVLVEWAVSVARGHSYVPDVFLLILAAAAVVVHQLTRGVRAGERHVDEQVGARMRVQRERQEQVLAAREAQERRRLLRGQVLSQLHRLADGVADLDEAERRTYRLLELAARDQLVARPLLGEPLSEAIATARERGATVDLYCDDEAAVPGSFRRISATVLDHAGAHDRARVSWRPGAGDRPRDVTGTVTLVPAGTAVDGGASSTGTHRGVARLDQLVQELSRWEGLEVVLDEADLLVQVHGGR